MQKLLKPIYLILFITIPQAFGAYILGVNYIDNHQMPSKIMMAVLAMHAVINVFVIGYYFKNKSEEIINKKIMQWLLASMVVVFSVGVVLLFNESNFNFKNLETIYLLLNTISLLYLVVAISLQTKGLDIKKQTIICIVIPVLSAIILGANTYFFDFENITFISAIGLFCGFAFFLIRLIFALFNSEKTTELTNQKMTLKYRIIVFVVAVIMPVIGLVINNSDSFFVISEIGVFGNFSNIWFYIIAVVNGLLMLIDTNDKKWSLLLLYFKTIGFVYIIYFTTIFIPIIPYGFLGIIYYGLGIFVFVPIAVFFIELFQMISDVKKLKAKFKMSIIIIVFGVITLPTVMAIDFTVDKVNFKNALTYLDSSSDKMPNVNIEKLKRPIKYIENNLGTRRNGGVFNNGINIPIISKFYQVISLDDKIMSNETLRKLSKIFFAQDVEVNNSFNIPRNQSVDLLNATTSTEFDETIGVYKTWVDLEVKNNSNMNLSEYKAEFSLPDGCFIKDYYLYVGNDKKHGILADKRAALITYNNIIRTPKDPGIIYYKSDNLIELRVYPFAPNQIRKTGFEVLHSQNEVLNINGKQVPLVADKPIDKTIDLQGVSFIPFSYKVNLLPSARKAKYHFLIDTSENSPYSEHIRKVNEFIEKNKIEDSKTYAVSYKMADFDNVKTEGGFNLSLAMELIFKNTIDGEFPIIIAVTDNIYKAPLFEKSSMAKLYPESEYYYNLEYDLALKPYSFSGNNDQNVVKNPIILKTLNYNGATVADNNKSEIVTVGDIGQYTDNEYYNALILSQKSLQLKDSSIIRDSFRQRLLTKHTAFTVLETAEQENSLLKLQERFLNGKMNDAPAVMMSEPSFFVCLIFVLLFVLYKRKLWIKS